MLKRLLRRLIGAPEVEINVNLDNPGNYEIELRDALDTGNLIAKYKLTVRQLPNPAKTIKVTSVRETKIR